jgi:hypothetical protein
VLADEGKIDKILMSHDIHTKHRLVIMILYWRFWNNFE